MKKIYLTATQTSSVLFISDALLSYWKKNGLGPKPTTRAGKLFYEWSDIEAFIKSKQEAHADLAKRRTKRLNEYRGNHE